MTHFYNEHYHGEPTVDIAPHMPTLESHASRAAFVLELGCGAGNGSTRAFSAGLRRSPREDRLHISVDIIGAHPAYECPDDPWWFKVTGSTTDPRTVLAVAEICGPQQADVIFIDTDHTYDQMRRELELWKEFSDPRTTWLFHDTHMFGTYNHMTDAIKEFAAREGWTFVDLTSESHGLGLMFRNP